MIYDCIIIGAGAAGLFCSSSAGLSVKGLILEKTKRPGTKLLMSGNGQCNITHSGSIKEFIQCYGKNGSKIRKCLYKYNNESLIAFLEDNGVKTVTRSDGKVFPASMNARDILNLLLRKTDENGFKIRYETPAERIEISSDSWSVYSGGEVFTAHTLVIASGGCSYPSTGSDGSLFHVLRRDLKLDITELKPALSSVQVSDYPYGELSGISFKNAMVSIWRDGKRLAQNEGGLLLTHRDLSGPAVMNISKLALPKDRLHINYIHPISYEEAFARMKSAVRNTKSGLASVMASEFRLPKRFCQIMIERHGDSIKNLARQMTCEEFPISSVSGFNRAMVTSGGLELSQLKLSTMELKDLPGLLAIGEAVDIDGITGGYNLQFAYSSARAAADCIAELLSTLR